MDHEPFHSWGRSPRGLREEAGALGHLDGSKQCLLPMGREIFQYLTTGASVPVAHQLNKSPDNSSLPKRPGGGPRANTAPARTQAHSASLRTRPVQQSCSKVAVHWHR